MAARGFESGSELFGQIAQTAEVLQAWENNGQEASRAEEQRRANRLQSAEQIQRLHSRAHRELRASTRVPTSETWCRITRGFLDVIEACGDRSLKFNLAWHPANETQLPPMNRPRVCSKCADDTDEVYFRKLISLDILFSLS